MKRSRSITQGAIEALKDILKKTNQEKFREIIVHASDIPVHDEWMLDDQWDEIYKEEENRFKGKQ